MTVYNREMGPSGGAGGTQTTLVPKNNQTITGFQVISGDWINHLTVFYSDNSSQSIGSNSGGTLQPKMTLQPGEKVIAIQGTYGSYVNSIQVVTNKDIHDLGGTRGPAEFKYEVYNCGDLIGVYGRGSKYVDAFGIVVRETT